MASLYIEFDHGTGGNVSISNFSWVDRNGVSHSPTVISSVGGFPAVGRKNTETGIYENGNVTFHHEITNGSVTYKFYAFDDGKVLSLAPSTYSLTFYSLNDAEEDDVRCGRVVVSDGSYNEEFYYVFQVTSIEEVTQMRFASGKLWDRDSVPAELLTSTGGSGEPSEPSETTTYEIRVDGASVSNNTFNATYNKQDHEIALYNNGTKITSPLIWLLDNKRVTADQGVLSCTDACYFREVEVLGYDATPVSFRIAPVDIIPSVNSGIVFNKYYDGLDTVVIPNNAFSYSGWLDNDGASIEITPSGTYESTGAKSTNTSNIQITFTFGLSGGNASNYTIPDLEGVTGNIYAMPDASKPTENGFALKVTKGRYGVAGSADLTDSADLSNNSDDNPFEVSYDAAGYYITVIKDNVIVDDDDYDADWIVAITYPDDSSSLRIRPASTSVGFTDTGLCMGRVYVQGISNNASYTQGYAYVGEVWLRILPVINVSWIACSYEG